MLINFYFISELMLLPGILMMIAFFCFYISTDAKTIKKEKRWLRLAIIFSSIAMLSIIVLTSQIV